MTSNSNFCQIFNLHNIKFHVILHLPRNITFVTLHELFYII
nr:MAG TPA: hypothetical protein [Caudoviricetes sp.]